MGHRHGVGAAARHRGRLGLRVDRDHAHQLVLDPGRGADRNLIQRAPGRQLGGRRRRRQRAGQDRGRAPIAGAGLAVGATARARGEDVVQRQAAGLFAHGQDQARVRRQRRQRGGIERGGQIPVTGLEQPSRRRRLRIPIRRRPHRRLRLQIARRRQAEHVLHRRHEDGALRQPAVIERSGAQHQGTDLAERIADAEHAAGREDAAAAVEPNLETLQRRAGDR
ncbi:hypothetical protein GLE_5540 [Lysobacter enzymogenes]|uniref:Uncharacterized protein n=1 Tax=Lysobacter enzymogenes TaxID=69 RepID=A0A0S2DQY7_LYSEN|nr:hypothetical protein GLE_0002 [Lysobacter enzymogenes]ALN60881.1 hypothetical protein GLE_5540 [Lysobacter enzymogenes]